MPASAWISRPALLAIACVLSACASTQPPGAEQTGTAAASDAKRAVPGQTRYHWTKATEAEVAAALDQKLVEAAKPFVKLKRNDELMFCKRYRDIGSMIPQLHCITVAELRKQVEDSDQLRDQMRHSMGRCDISSGCSAEPSVMGPPPGPR